MFFDGFDADNCSANEYAYGQGKWEKAGFRPTYSPSKTKPYGINQDNHTDDK